MSLSYKLGCNVIHHNNSTLNKVEDLSFRVVPSVVAPEMIKHNPISIYVSLPK